MAKPRGGFYYRNLADLTIQGKIGSEQWGFLYEQIDRLQKPTQQNAVSKL